MFEEQYWDIVIPTAGKGGVENCINILSRELIKLGYKIRVVQLVSEGYKWLDEDIPFYEMTYGKDGHDVNELAEKYAQFLLNNSFPSVVIATNWPLCVYITKLSLAACGVKIPVISWIHNMVERYMSSGYGGYEFLGLADAHLAISDFIHYEIRRNLENSVVYRVNNPVIFESQREVAREKNFSHKLAFLGRISEEKGLDIILKAMTFTSEEWTLEVVGDTTTIEEKNQLIEEIDNLKIAARVRLWGWQKKPWDILDNIDFICMPSRFEGFPLVAIEALSRGIPVIATAVSGIVEIVIPGETGYLISQQNPRELAEILDYISLGKLPMPSAERCVSAVFPRFDARNVAEEFCEAVIESIKSN